MVVGRRSWPTMATVLLALLVCLGRLVDADSKSQPSAEKASRDKQNHHHASLRHYFKLANRVVPPNLLESLLSKWFQDRESCPVK
uniref:Uncharacterized protein n=1 Tax=Moschus moschiferus TaxID=68415 RepID=A0A8C6EEL7_MOSMO